MRLATINVAGWSQPHRLETGLKKILQLDIDIIALQEPNITSTGTLLARLGAFSSHYQCYASKLSGIIVRKSLTTTDLHHSPCGRVTCLNVETPEGLTLCIVSVYAPANHTERALFFQTNIIGATIKRAAPPHSIPRKLVILGDFNDYPDPLLDRTASATAGAPRCWHDLSPFLHTAALEDVPRTFFPTEPMFTNTVTKNNTIIARTRIDHIFASPSLLDRSKQNINTMPFVGTNHLMLVWNWHKEAASNPTNQPLPRGKGTWSLHIGYVMDVTLQNFIAQHLRHLIDAHGKKEWTWQDWLTLKESTRQVCIRLTNNRVDKPTEQSVDDCLRQLQQLSIHDPQVTKVLEELQHHQSILEAQVTYQLDKRAIEMESVPSTKHEHHARETTTPQFRMKDGVSLTQNIREMVQTVYEYYSELATPDPKNNIPPPQLTDSLPHRKGVAARGPNPLPPHLHPTQVSAAEVSSRITAATKGSSPGFDGLPYEFYQKHSALLSPVLASAINSILHGNTKPIPGYPILHGKLIPKKVAPGQDGKHLKFQRPLNIADADFRIASLVISKRLAYYAEKLVTVNQTAFLRNRGMEENGLTTYLLIEHFNDQIQNHNPMGCFAQTPSHANDTEPQSPNNSRPGILFLDQEKAFDRVRWDHAFHCMRFYGIPEIYIRFYETILQSPRTIYEVHGHLARPITLTQGHPQGDPSSPLIFLISQQPFQDRLVMRNIFLPIYLNNKRIDIESQAYADDLDAPINTNDQHEDFKTELALYNRTANSKLNASKTTILAGHPLPNQYEADWRSEYTPQPDEFTIVGYPVRANGSCPSTLLINKLKAIRKRAGLWSLCHLSIFGRARVSNSLLTSSIWHAIQLCPLEENDTSTILDQLQRIIFDFVLGSRMRYLAWKTLTATKLQGGLGLLDPPAMSHAMMGRTLARALLKSTSTKTNSSELLRETLIAAGHRMISPTFTNDPQLLGLLIWLIRKGTAWRERKRSLSPFLYRISCCLETLTLEPGKQWAVFSEDWDEYPVRLLPIYSTAYRPTYSGTKKGKMGKKARASLASTTTEPLLELDAITHFEAMGDRFGNFLQFGICSFKDVLRYDPETNKNTFRYATREDRKAARKTLPQHLTSTEDSKFRDAIASLAKLWPDYWNTLPKGLRDRLETTDLRENAPAQTIELDAFIPKLYLANTELGEYSVKLGRNFLSTTSEPLPVPLWTSLDNANLIPDRIVYPDLWNRLCRGGPQRILSNVWLFLHNATSNHPPSQAQKAASLQTTTPLPRFIIGECTTCGLKPNGRDTTIHGYILCPRVEEAWFEVARVLDNKNSNWPDLYPYVCTENIATAFAEVSPDPTNQERIFRWWACTISAIATRRSQAFETARQQDQDANVCYEGLAKDVFILLSNWNAPIITIEETICHAAEDWETRIAEPINKEIPTPRSQRKPPPTLQHADTAKTLKDIIGFIVLGKGKKGRTQYRIRLTNNETLQAFEPEVLALVNGPEKLARYKEKKSLPPDNPPLPQPTKSA